MAPAWAGATWFSAATDPVARRLVDLLDPKPGEQVLELAAGPGDTGLLALPALQPGGRLLMTDVAHAMVAVASSRAAHWDGAAVVEACTMDAERLELFDASVDGVLCRWGYMHADDPLRALRETRRVLRPGGRVALACWDAAHRNPWNLGPLLVELGVVAAPAPDQPGPFRLADPDQLERLLDAASFRDVVVEQVDFAFEADSAEAWWQQQLHCSLSLAQAARQLDHAGHQRVRAALGDALAAFAQPDGTLRLPARTHVARAFC